MSPKNKSAKNLFQKSVGEQKPRSFLKGFAETKIESRRFVHSTERLVHSVEFHSEAVKKSKKLHEYRFTNFLHPTNTPPEITQRIYQLIQNPAIVDNEHLGEVRTNEKIEECIKLYVSNLPEDTFVYKSDLRDSFGQQLGVRVYIIFELPNDDPDMNVVFKITLIDPFHLVIPSKHGSYRTKEEMERQVYMTNEGNRVCISDWLSSQFF